MVEQYIYDTSSVHDRLATSVDGNQAYEALLRPHKEAIRHEGGGRKLVMYTD